MKKQKLKRAHRRTFGSFFLPTIALVILVLFCAPLMVSHLAGASGQLAARSLSISSGVPGNTAVQYKFKFTVVATSTLQSLKFEACTTAVNTCTAPPGLSFAAATFVSQNNFDGTNNFAIDNTGGNTCTPAANVLCANRTDATNMTVNSKDITFGGITNPTTANTAFFVRITTYGDNAYTGGVNIQDTGTTASAVVQTLTTTAAVAEVLNFCIGSTVGNTDSDIMPLDCSAVSGTTVNLGVLTNTQVNVSPVGVPDGGDGNNGLAMLRTNATSGATIGYDAIQDPFGTGGGHYGTLRIQGSNCTASVVATDPCINAIGTTQAAIVSGTENFGMTIAAVNCNSTTSYSCTFAAGDYNLVRATDYDGTGSNTYPTDSGLVAGTTNAGYAWDETGTIDNIANSSTYVDDEVLMLKFGATSSITTPFGAYAVSTDFIAVPTY